MTYEELGPVLQAVAVAQAADEVIDVAGLCGNVRGSPQTGMPAQAAAISAFSAPRVEGATAAPERLALHGLAGPGSRGDRHGIGLGPLIYMRRMTGFVTSP